MGLPLREAYFKTRHGNRYRVLFAIRTSMVDVLCVRGPGQQPVRQADLLLE